MSLDMNSTYDPSSFSFSKSNSFKIGHFNAQSLNPCLNKFQEIFSMIYKSKFDIIGISETWLKPSILDSAVKIPGFNMYRCDRDLRKGGGVAFYVSSKLKCKELFSISHFCSDSDNYELLILEVSSNVDKLVCGVTYIPPRVNFHC